MKTAIIYVLCKYIICLYTWAHIHMCAHMCMFVWRLENNLSYWSSGTVHTGFESGALPGLALVNLLGQCASKIYLYWLLGAGLVNARYHIFYIHRSSSFTKWFWLFFFNSSLRITGQPSGKHRVLINARSSHTCKTSPSIKSPQQIGIHLLQSMNLLWQWGHSYSMVYIRITLVVT